MLTSLKLFYQIARFGLISRTIIQSNKTAKAVRTCAHTAAIQWLFLSVLAIFYTKPSEAQTYTWTKGFGSAASDGGKAIAVDPLGNVFVVGYFSDTVDFDPGPGVANLTTAGLPPFSFGNYDIFLAKYDAAGNYVWARRFGSNSAYANGLSPNDAGTEIKLDAVGNIFIAGYFADTIDFDPGPGVTTLTAVGESDMFFAKYDSSGALIWANSLGNSSYGGDAMERITAMELDNVGNVYLTGYFYDTIDFDPGIGSANLNTLNGRAMFIAKYDANGNYIWASAVTPDVWADHVLANGLALDSSNNLYITGVFEGTADFDPGPGVTTLVSNGARDVFFAKYRPNGAFVFARGMGGDLNDWGYTINLDGAGNSYISGVFQGDSIDLNPGPDTNYFYHPIGLIGSGDPTFLTKFDSTGEYISATVLQSVSVTVASVLLRRGKLYITGTFTTSSDFDPGPNQALLTSAGLTDIFFASYDTGFNYKSSVNLIKGIGGEAVSKPIIIGNDLYLTGGFGNETIPRSADFDPGADSAIYTSLGQYDIFIAKYSLCEMDSTTVSSSICAGQALIVNGHSYGNTGIYRDTFQSIYGCDSLVVTNLVVQTIDTSLIITATTIISNALSGSFQWIDCNNGNAPIAGATNQTYAPLASGTYAVVISQNGCSDTSDCIVFTKLGIDNNNLLASGIAISPNPSSGRLTLSIPELFSNTELSIYNLLGEKVFKQRINSTLTILDLQLVNGVYFVNLHSDRGIQGVFRLIISNTR